MKNQKRLILDRFTLWQALITVIVLAIIFLLIINQKDVQFLGNHFQSVTKSDLQIYFFDVGQASSTLIITPDDKSILFDTGSTDSAESLVESMQYVLSKNGITGLDMLILSHSDADHVGGVVEVLEEFDVGYILRPKQLSYIELSQNNYQVVTTFTYAAAINAIQREGCQVDFVQDAQMNFGGLNIEIFAPERTDYTETNSFSPFILGEYYNKTFLLTADATQEREQEFLNTYFKTLGREISVDFLQVAHHGSKYSSSPNFLKAISPRYAFVSAGDDTHPSNIVLQRLKDVGVEEIFVTKEVGMIGVGINIAGFVICDMHRFFDIPLCTMLLCVFLFASWHFFDCERDRTLHNLKK